MASTRRARTRRSTTATERPRRLLAAAHRGCAAALTLLWLSAAPAAPLWLAERDDTTLYLLGSIHVLDAGTVAGNALLADAYARTASVVLEMDLADIEPMHLKRLLREHAFLTDGRTLADLIGPVHWPGIEAAADAADVDLSRYRRSEPWHAAMLVTQQLMQRQGFDGDNGVDTVVARWAERDGKAVSGLETAAQQIGFFDNLTPAAQRELLARTLREAADLDEDLHALSRAWRDGDLAFIEAALYPELADIPELYQRLLVERNRTWVERIAALGTEEPVLVVVGALHLVGPNSLIAGLEQRGFRIRRIMAHD